MRVAFLILNEYSGKGGVEKVLCTVTEYCEKSGVEPYIYFLQAPIDRSYLENFENCYVAPEKYSKFSLMLKPLLPKFVWGIIKRKVLQDSLRELLLVLEKDGVEAIVNLNISRRWFGCIEIFQMFKKKHPRIPLLLWPHGTMGNLRQRKRKSLVSFLGLFDYFLAISSGIAEEISELVASAKIKVVYNPVENSALLPRSQGNRFVYVGRMHPKKRVFEMVKILSKVEGEWQLDIIGAPNSEEEKKYVDHIKKYIYDHSLEKKIIWHGWQEVPFSVLQDASALLLHSLTEGLPLVLIEAIMRGIPCISSDCLTGPRDIIVGGENGWLYDVYDEERLLKILQGIVNGDLELPSQITVQNSARKFSIEVVCDNIISGIEEAIEIKNQQ